METLVQRLRKRAEIRRSIPRGEPDRISDILEEAAANIEELEMKLQHSEDVIRNLRVALDRCLVENGG